MGRVKAREKFTVTIDSLDQEGRGVCRRDGKVAFIEGALPGEIVQYERFKNKQSFEIGSVVDIYRESSLRIHPRCPYFGMHDGCCGGCAMQHLEPRAQVAIKQKILTDTLKHIGKVRSEQLLPPIFGPFWGYRHRARLSVRDVEKKGTVLVGFREKRSSYVADMRSCEILPKKMSNLLVPLRELISTLSIRKSLPQIEVAIAGDVIALVLRVLEQPTARDEQKLRNFQKDFQVEFWYQPEGPDSIYPLNPENIDHLKLSHPQTGVVITFKPTDFTQVNHQLNIVMIDRALRLLELEPVDHVADFFCGLGNFSLPLAKRAGKVLGIEGSEQLVARATVAAQENGLADKTSFRARNLFTWTEQDWDELWHDLQGISKVLIDPPREGAMAVCQALSKTYKRPQLLVYVSCNPATLARDANILVNEGSWILKAAGVMNMFPHTAHVESIAVFANESPPQSKSAEQPPEIR